MHPKGFPITILYKFLVCPITATSPANRSFLEFNYTFERANIRATEQNTESAHGDKKQHKTSKN